jgi:glutamate synthase (ferredoxin)
LSHPFSPQSSPYAPRFDRGGCGIGFVADQHGNASHALLNLALEALNNLQHRGALSADARTGDGAGVLTPLPRRLFAREAERLTGRPVNPDQLAVGVFFFQPDTAGQCMALAESALATQGLRLLCWREVPTHPDAIGERARATMPRIMQAIATNQLPITNYQLEHSLYLARKNFERQARPLGAYVPSFSSRTIVYKGLLLAGQLPAFYADLQDPDYEVPLAVFHQRYSTNTLPTWQRAQPFRVLCHNGEINTLQGNINWMKTREPLLSLPDPKGFGNPSGLLRPVVDTNGSDSAMLDNAVELLMMGGRDIRHALTMLVPPAWEKLPDLPEAVRDFYEYHTCLTEPWDGPAALVFTDGLTVGAALDRNGLRPCRYAVTEDGLIAAASEAGAVTLDESRILAKGKLGPGQMIAVDTKRGLFFEDGQIKTELAARKPYGVWLRDNLRKLPAPNSQSLRFASNLQSPISTQAAFGYTNEELVMVLRPMVENKAEAVGSMGDDTSPAVLSDKPRPLFGYFRQRFAEVTNPPIDPLREELVMSLRVRLGARGNFLAETPAQARLLELDSPFLTDAQLATLKADPELKAVTLSTLFRAAEGAAGLKLALDRLCAEAEQAAQAGAQAIILSDRGVDAEHTFIPSLLALGAVHHHLLRQDLRVQVDLVVESGEPREVHHFAALVGYSAAAINPYLALATAQSLITNYKSPGDSELVISNYLHAAERGLLKIMSKMGISTVDAYCGAQIFEVIGLSREVVDVYFAGTASHLEGIGLGGIAEIVLAWHRAAFGTDRPSLDSPGFYKFKRNGELHAFSPAVVQALREAVRTPGALNGHWAEGHAAYKRYSELQHSRAPVDIRDLLDFHTNYQLPITVNQVEPVQGILRRFSTAAMSHGALSKEAHETMAIAMNRLGAWSNSGEGGEDPARYYGESNDRIKQVASARFGVTPAYLVSADELQIKMAQGSKPGEGGQLPGHKVTAEIAAIRHATPGVTLISPPPHHDIYSIEDLAQLIYDLRQINPRAIISVKLVAQAGVGTIAAGVAKAGADVILISGGSGGTGASPLSSIKYAGIPWELGLAEAQYVLIENGLRGRVRLRADGGLRTGRDVVIAALLGADEYSFGTAAVVAEGCLMARACHLNTCPAGIATQRPELRAKFDGTPEQIMAFFLHVAEEVREILAGLGLASLDEAVGRVELLQQITGERPLDLSRLLLAPPGDGPRRYTGEPNRVPLDSPLNDQLLADCEHLALFTRPWRFLRGESLMYHITNRDRAFGAKVAGEIATRYGDAGLPEDSVKVTLYGSAGQSFGAFGVPGLNLTLTGEANDYVGKGLAGGRIVIKSQTSNLKLPISNSLISNLQSPVLAGNTVLYGATGGEVFIAGRAGERFAVRNSGATAVVEGVGDHGCEYMTGGLAIILGSIGYNFAAGMTGGVAFLLDEGGRAAMRINRQLVEVEAPTGEDLELLRVWITQHAQLAASHKARALLDNWAGASKQFLKVAPKDQPGAALPVPVAIPAVAVPAEEPV